jgi:hypothetical protein
VRERLLRARIELARPGGQPALARHFAFEALEAARAGGEREFEWRALQAAAASAENGHEESSPVELLAAAQEIVEGLLANVPENRREAYLKADPARAAALRGDSARATLVSNAPPPSPRERPRIELRAAFADDDDAPTRPGLLAGRRRRAASSRRELSPISPPLLGNAVTSSPARPPGPLVGAPAERASVPSNGDVARADFAAILGLNRRIVEERRVERLYSHLVESVAKLCRADRAFLAFFGATESDLTVLASRGVTEGELLSPSELFARTTAHRAAESRSAAVPADGILEDARKRSGLVVPRSVLAVPVRSPDGRRGALYLDHVSESGVFGARERKLVEAVADQCALACGRAALERARERAIGPERGQTPRGLLRSAHRAPVRPFVEPARFFGLVGHSGPLRRAIARLVEAARTDDPILIFGPHGVGKEKAARALHAASARSQRPFVVVDVRDAKEAIDLERALLGSDEFPLGARGTAQSGTLVVKAIDAGPSEAQRTLARILVDLAEARRSGAPRLVATASSEEAIAPPLAALFSKVRVFLPSLRDRREDVIPLTEEVLSRLAHEQGGGPKTLSAAASEALVGRPLPGEAREIIATLVAAWARAGKRREILAEDLPPPHARPERRRVGGDEQ